MIKAMHLLCLMALVAAFPLRAEDPLLGTWKLNTAKSRRDYATPSANGNATLTFTKDGDWVVRTSERLGQDGKPRTSVVRHTNDGKENPWGDGVAAVNKLSDYYYEWTFRSDSRGTGRGVTVITADARTLVETYAGTDPKGQKVDYVIVYEK